MFRRGRYHPRRQGDLGEVAAISWLAQQGAKVLFPLLHSPDYDLVADFDGKLSRIQVKTCTYQQAPERFVVQLETRGGNQSWSGTGKYFDPSRADYLFVLVGNGRQWFIPCAGLTVRTRIVLGGPKYAEFEVASGFALPPVPRRASLAPLH